MKCEMCNQERMKKARNNGLSYTYVCINSKCPDYFEPAAAQKQIGGTPRFPDIQEPVVTLAGSGAAQKQVDAINPTFAFGGAKVRVEGAEVCVVCKTQLEADPLGIYGVLACRTCNPQWFRRTWASTPLYTPPTEPARGLGIKLDNNKPLVYTEFLQQFPRAIRLVARVGERGSQAPGHVRSGWKSVEQGYERYSDAFARHILKEATLATMEEPDSSDPMHDLIWEAATVAWNSLARLEHLVKQNPGAAERIDGDPLA